MVIKKIIPIDQISNYVDKYIKIEYIEKRSSYSWDFIKDCNKLLFILRKVVKEPTYIQLLLVNKNCNNSLGHWTHSIYNNCKHPFIYLDMSDRIIII